MTDLFKEVSPFRWALPLTGLPEQHWPSKSVVAILMVNPSMVRLEKIMQDKLCWGKGCVFGGPLSVEKAGIQMNPAVFRKSQSDGVIFKHSCFIIMP